MMIIYSQYDPILMFAAILLLLGLVAWMIAGLYILSRTPEEIENALLALTKRNA